MTVAARDMAVCEAREGEVSEITAQCPELFIKSIYDWKEKTRCSQQPNEVQILSRKLEMEITESPQTITKHLQMETQR